MPVPEMVAFTGFDRTTVKFSLPSVVVSPFTSTVTVLVAWPGLNVSVPVWD